MDIRLLYVVFLFLNGVGTSILAVGFPYRLLSHDISMTEYYTLVCIIFMAMALGTLIWGRIIDRTPDIWRARLFIFLAELVCSGALLVALLCHVQVSMLLLALVIAALEFLLAYEIPWSRVAWYRINTWKAQTSGRPYDTAFTIVVATTMISAIGPGTGAMLGIQYGITLLVWIKVASIIPYALICAYVYRATQAERSAGQDSQHAVEAGGLNVLWAQSYYRYLGGAVACVLMANAFLIVSLPIQVFSSLASDGGVYVLLFYFLSSVMPLLFVMGLNKTAGSRAIIARPLMIFVTLACTGCTFYCLPSFPLKTLFYLGYNVAYILFNTFVSELLYHEQLADKQGRLFSLLQLISSFAFPVAAVVISIAPASWQDALPLIGFGCLSGLAVVLYLMLPGTSSSRSSE